MPNQVIALVSFTDTLTARDYRPGDVVAGWDADRVAHYAARGLVRVDEARAETEALPAGPTEQPAIGPTENTVGRRPKTRK